MRHTAQVALTALLAGAAPAVRAQAPEVQVRAVPEFVAVRPGGTFRVAVRLQIPQGWHIGWINPGAGGLATTVAWQTPKGVEARATAWPYPETDDADGEISHVYRGTAVLFSTFDAAQDLSAPLTLSAQLEWGLCRVQCVLQRRTLQISLPTTRGVIQRSSAWADVQLAERSLPVAVPAGDVHVVLSGDSAAITIAGLPNAPPADSWVTFFPLERGRASVVARLRGAPGSFAFSLPTTALTGAPPGHLLGVLVAAHPPGAPPSTRPLAVDVPILR